MGPYLHLCFKTLVIAVYVVMFRCILKHQVLTVFTDSLPGIRIQVKVTFLVPLYNVFVPCKVQQKPKSAQNVKNNPPPTVSFVFKGKKRVGQLLDDSPAGIKMLQPVIFHLSSSSGIVL